MSSAITVPNALTFLRFLGIPIFIHLAINLEADGWAILVLAIGGATDYFDGKIARAWNQTSTLGAMLDPAADRIYIVATLVVLYLRQAIPLWVVLVLLGRDFVLALITLIMKIRRVELIEVTYLGKAATFNLLYAFPLLLLATRESLIGQIAFAVGWGFASWGIVLYVYTGITYFQSAVKSIRVAFTHS